MKTVLKTPSCPDSYKRFFIISTAQKMRFCVLNSGDKRSKAKEIENSFLFPILYKRALQERRP